MRYPLGCGALLLSCASLVQAAPPPAAVAEWNALLATCELFQTVAGNGGTVGTLEDNDWLIALGQGTNFEGGSALACNLSNPHMADADALGNIYIADKSSHAILKVSPDGLVHTLVGGTHTAGNGADAPQAAFNTSLNQPNGLYVLPNGTVYVYDPGNHRIRKITPAGVSTTIVNDPDPNWFSSGRGLWVSQAEDLIYYTMEVEDPLNSTLSIGGVVKKWTPTGGIEPITAYPAIPNSTNLQFRNPGNIDVNPVDGKLYVTDRAEDDPTPMRSKVWRIDTQGVGGAACVRTSVAGSGTSSIPGGDGELATATFLDEVRGIAFLPNGAYFLATHQGGDIWYVDTFGYIHLFIQGRGGRDLHLGNGATSLPLIGQEFISEPRAIVVAPNGDLLITTNDSGYVRRVRRNADPAAPIIQETSMPTANQWHMQWSSEIGRTYLVERSFDLQGPWDVRQIVTSTTTLSTFMETIPSGHTKAFYRLAPPR